MTSNEKTESPQADVFDRVDALIAELRDAELEDRQGIKGQLTDFIRGDGGATAREHLESQLKLELLEVQWELEDVLEATAPEPEEPQTSPDDQASQQDPDEADAADGKLSPSDLNLVYDDPRGLMLHQTKDGTRWFATQVDPRSGQPQTFELHSQEVSQLKSQLQGSPYWVVGAGA